jgi:hypothetical protein
MATASSNYASAASVTITLTSLGIDGWRESAGIDNGTNLYLDAVVSGSIQVGAVGADGTIEVYAYGSIDGGTIYDGGLVGTNETITWGTTPSTSSVKGFNQLHLLTVIDVDATDDNNDIEFVCKTSVAQAFGGVMPEDWGIVIRNNTDTALHATGTNNAIKYGGYKIDVA